MTKWTADNNAITNHQQKVGGGGGDNSNSNGSGNNGYVTARQQRNGDGDGLQWTVRQQHKGDDIDGRCDGNATAIDGVTATAINRAMDGDDGNDGNGRRNSNASVTTTMDGTMATQR